MTTLLEYAKHEFPGLDIDVDVIDVDEPTRSDRAVQAGAVELQEHTVVAHVVGVGAAAAMVADLHAAGFADVVAVRLRPPDAGIIPVAGEDHEGIVHLPRRRPAVAAATGGLCGALALSLLGASTSDDGRVVLVLAGFGILIGAVIGAMLGGLGRHAGDRAWSQPVAPGQTIIILAAFTASNDSAVAVSREMERLGPHEVRILSAGGLWHSPNT